MKKVLTIFSLFVGGSLCALPIGNPSEASLLCEGVVKECLGCDVAPFFWDCFHELSFRVGYYGDFVQNRHLEVDENFSDGKEVEITEIETDSGYLAVNIWNRVDLFATFGASHFFLQLNENLFTDEGNGERFQLYTETDFSWSIGLRGTLWECGCLAFGGEAQYFSTRPDVRLAGIINEPFVYPDEIVDLKYHEWQIGLGLSYQVNAYFVPYAAIKWSGAHVDFDDAQLVVDPGGDDIPYTLFNLKNRKTFGYAVGLSFVACDRFSFTLERRFADERATYFNAQFRF